MKTLLRSLLLLWTIALPEAAIAQGITPEHMREVTAMMSVILHPDQIGADSLWTLILSVSQVQDQAVFDQAAALAVDRTATTFARAGALLVLAGQVGSTLGFYSNSTPVTPTELFTVPREMRPTCNLEPRFAPDPPVGPNPLDADAERQVLRIFDPIIVDDTEPLLLRKLADCARPIVPGVPPQVDVSGVQLTYVCERSFRIAHPHPISLPFRYEVDGSSESQKFSVNPGESMLLMPAAYSDGLAPLPWTVSDWAPPRRWSNAVCSYSFLLIPCTRLGTRRGRADGALERAAWGRE